jgi:hypothetical protein
MPAADMETTPVLLFPLWLVLSEQDITGASSLHAPACMHAQATGETVGLGLILPQHTPLCPVAA